ncbi:hypothetical protein BpHYR1_005013 [Brachionus plicatilis]|uniref:Uncharacterized protein n=1 Tax=Brachionus plicatilis TaxID=10195 RepID=A0A3M7Q364_BRAPC|nr:hypothetical protein BpHYR1_005013 [Brachionus plicatilis]
MLECNFRIFYTFFLFFCTKIHNTIKIVKQVQRRGWSLKSDFTGKILNFTLNLTRNVLRVRVKTIFFVRSCLKVTSLKSSPTPGFKILNTEERETPDPRRKLIKIKQNFSMSNNC